MVTNFTQAGIEAALTNGGTITFSTNGTITLTNALKILTNTTIDGSGLAITFSGSSTTRVFYVNNNATLALANLSVVNGRNTNGAGIFVSAGSTVNLTNCTLSGHHAFGPNGKNGNDASNYGDDGGNGTAGTNAIGGAIYNLGTVSIFNSLISSNTASGGDGGSGGLGGNSSSIGGAGGNGGNGAFGWGGGIYNGTNAALLIVNTTLTNNFALGGFGGAPGDGGTAPFPKPPGQGGAGANGLGGGIYNIGSVTITNSTVVTNAAIGGDSAHAKVDKSGNVGGAADGGGIYNLGTVMVGNSTFTRNFAEGGKGGDVYADNFHDGGNGGNGRGGAIFNSNTVNLVNCTLATNNATGGPAGINPISSGNGSKGASLGGNIYRLAGTVTLHNTILAKGTSGANYAFAGSTAGFVNGGFNLSSDGTPSALPTASKNKDPKLAALANNGGPTATMALRTNSPAIDKGDPNFHLATDQRGSIRPQGLGFDIGAFELVPTFSISGTIFEGTNGVSNIVVTAGTQTATSAANGTYTIGGLIASNYVVTPMPLGAGFTPVSTNVSVGTNITASGNVTNINFFANPATIRASAISFVSTNQNLSNAVFSLQFTGMPQRTYKVQYSTNLSSTNWKNISTNLSTTNGFFQFNQTNLSKDPQKFFRTVVK